MSHINKVEEFKGINLPTSGDRKYLRSKKAMETKKWQGGRKDLKRRSQGLAGHNGLGVKKAVSEVARRNQPSDNSLGVS